MSRQQILLLGIAFSLLVFFLVGCGGSPPAAVSEVPKATSAPEQAAATPEPPTATSVPPTAMPIPPTPTPEPPMATPIPPTATPVPPTPTPEPPTATPTPAVVNPQPGAAFTGVMEISKAGNSGTASSGTVKLVVSEDGSSITSAEITLTDLKCPSSSSGSMTLTVGDPAHPSPINEGKIEIIASSLGEQTIEGQFTSPTEANGTATMTLEIPFEKPCDFGMWEWSAKASASTSAQSSSDATTGQVRGVLIDQDSQQPIGEVSAFLAEVNEGGGFSVSEESPAVETNKAGEFTFEEVPPGKYMLISGTKSPERDDKGKIVPAFNAFIPPMKDDKGEVIIIEVVAGEVIDLGQVLTVSSNFP